MSKGRLRQALTYNLKGALMLLTKAYDAYGEAKTKFQLWHDKDVD
jgi:outer membrane phospholipase A